MIVRLFINEPKTWRVDLNEKLDLTTYSPEKALHLDLERVRQNTGMATFRDNFALVWKYREGICQTPELSNITDKCIGWGASFAGFSEMPLGALLLKYNQGLLRCELCPSCQCPTLGYYSARGLSGVGFHHTFCPNCGHDFQKYPNRLDDLIDKTQLCPRMNTAWRLCDLIFALQRKEEK